MGPFKNEASLTNVARPAFSLARRYQSEEENYFASGDAVSFLYIKSHGNKTKLRGLFLRSLSAIYMLKLFRE